MLDYIIENKDGKFVFGTPNEIWVVLDLLKNETYTVKIFDYENNNFKKGVLKTQKSLSYENIKELSLNPNRQNYTESLCEAYLKLVNSDYDPTNDLNFLAERDCLINPTLV